MVHQEKNKLQAKVAREYEECAPKENVTEVLQGEVRTKPLYCTDYGDIKIKIIKIRDNLAALVENSTPQRRKELRR